MLGIKDLDILFLSKLEWEEIENVKFVNKYFFKLCNDDNLWRRKLEEFSFKEETHGYINPVQVYTFKIGNNHHLRMVKCYYVKYYKESPKKLYHSLYTEFMKYKFR